MLGLSAPVRSYPMIALYAVAAPFSIATLVYGSFGDVGLPAIAVAAAVLIVIVARLAITAADGQRLSELTHVVEITDPVTGLGNRKKLLDDLDALLSQDEPPPSLLLLFDLQGFEDYNDDFGHAAGDAMLARLSRKLVSVLDGKGAAYRSDGDEFCILSPVGEDDAEQLIERASEALTESGNGFLIGSVFGGVLVPHETTETRQALRLADERLHAQKRSKQGVRTLTALVEALSSHAPEAPFTTEGVEALSVMVGRMLGLEGDELDALARAAELHDVGNLAVPERILAKPGRLDPSEWDFVRRHPIVGERLLRLSPELHRVASIVRATHEHWDGSGYPDGLTEEEIPLAARIICACHAFLAMTSARPYRPAMTVEEALAELEVQSGTIFDPGVVRVLGALARARLEAARAA